MGIIIGFLLKGEITMTVNNWQTWNSKYGESDSRCNSQFLNHCARKQRLGPDKTWAGTQNKLFESKVRFIYL